MSLCHVFSPSKSSNPLILFLFHVEKSRHLADFPLSQISSLFSRTKGSNQDEYNESLLLWLWSRCINSARTILPSVDAVFGSWGDVYTNILVGSAVSHSAASCRRADMFARVNVCCRACRNSCDEPAVQRSSFVGILKRDGFWRVCKASVFHNVTF